MSKRSPTPPRSADAPQESSSDRIAAALEKLANAAADIAAIMQHRYEKEFPIPNPDDEQPEVFRAGEVGDAPESIAEYEALPDDGPGRFESLLKAAKLSSSKD